MEANSRKKRLSCIAALFFACITAQLLLSVGCDPPSDRDIWANALNGGYDQVMRVYLDSSRLGEPASPRIGQGDRDDATLLPTTKTRRVSGYQRRLMCLDALQALGDDNAISSLFEILKKEQEPNFRVAEAIVCCGNDGARKQLIKLFNTSDGSVKEAIGQGLAAASYSCSASDPGVVDALCWMLKSGSDVSRHSAAWALTRVPDLNHALRVKAKMAILKRIDEEQFPDVWGIAPWAIDVIEYFDGDDVRDLIREIIKRAKAKHRGPPLTLLHKLPEHEVIGFLERFSKHKNELARAAVGHSAPRLATPRAINVVKILIEDDSEIVRGSIAESLEKAFPERNSILSKLSRDESPRVRGLTAVSLVRLRSYSAKSVMLRLLDDEDKKVVRNVAEALAASPGLLSDDELKPVLLRLATHEDESLRLAAAKLIASLSMDSMDDALLKLAADDSYWVRREAYKALFEANPDSLRRLVLQ
ncbi:HEAT repeat domain-containing protein [bacterium]|nr:HEAT repeat domain-containing protein [bacterium]